MPSYIPWGLYRPFPSSRGTDTLAVILGPLVFLLGAAILSAAPIYDVKGAWMATLYVFVAFHALCFLRRWTMRSMAIPTKQGGLYISPSLGGLVEFVAIIVPCTFWIGISFAIAYSLWG